MPANVDEESVLWVKKIGGRKDIHYLILFVELNSHTIDIIECKATKDMKNK